MATISCGVASYEANKIFIENGFEHGTLLATTLWTPPR